MIATVLVTIAAVLVTIATALVTIATALDTMKSAKNALWAPNLSGNSILKRIYESFTHLGQGTSHYEYIIQ